MINGRNVSLITSNDAWRTSGVRVALRTMPEARSFALHMFYDLSIEFLLCSDYTLCANRIRQAPLWCRGLQYGTSAATVEDAGL